MIITRGFGSFGVVILKGFNGYVKSNNSKVKSIKEIIHFKSLIEFEVKYKVKL